MKLSKCFRHALKMVLHSKLRSWLTIAGIVIGVASVIAIVSLGEGMQETMEEQMGGLGADLLTLTAGASRGGRMPGMFGGGGQATEEEIVLDRSDLQAIKGVSGIELINTIINGNVEISYLGKSGSVQLTGVDQKVWASITTEEIAEGRMLDSADQNVIVIGGRLAESYFDQPLGINKVLTIEGSSFRIVGILEESSNSVYMPIQMAYQVLEDKENDVYDSIVIKVKDSDNVDEIIEKIENKLMITRHVTEKEKDFTVSSSQQMQETRSEMMESMEIFLLAIAAVSLIVGAIGVANTMFTSVLEKTKEIGIMKAIGARNKDILMIFLFNSGLIGFVGGVIGIFVGIFLSGALPYLMGETTMMFARGGTYVSFSSVVMAVFVSIFVGITSGIVPAYQASKLRPVDALRYE